MADTRFIFRSTQPTQAASISPKDLLLSLQGTNPHLVVDIRPPEEYASVIIAGAIPLLPSEIPSYIATLDPSAHTQITLYCTSGVRAERAAHRLVRLGHSHITNLAGGLAAWRAAGLPTVPSQNTPPPTTPLSERYARQTILPQLGAAGQARLAAARVLIVGAGGLGSPAALYLAAAGVGTIGIIDDDRVDVSNLQRQILHAESTIGALKVDSAASRLRALNSAVDIITYPTRLDAATAAALFGTFDLVVDGSDNLATRYVINDACVDHGIPFVYGALYHFDGQVAVFNLPGGPCYRCLYPAPPPAALAPSCAEAGVLGAICGVIGSLQATAALRVLVGLTDPSRHELLSIDALNMQIRTLTLAQDPRCMCSLA